MIFDIYRGGDSLKNNQTAGGLYYGFIYLSKQSTGKFGRRADR
jgi:hypothetical protein